MHDIHPTAIVDPQTEIGEGVSIGPWCMVHGKVKIGAGTQLQERVTLRGPIEIGAENHFYPQVTIGLWPQDRKFGPHSITPGVVIGDKNVFREGVTIHAATAQLPTRIGNHNMFMVNSHLAHDVNIGNHCTLANGALIAGHVQIQDNVNLSGNALVHQFCRLGRLSMISGAMFVVQDLPPFCTVYVSRHVGSLNFVGLRRAGLRDSILPLKRAFEILYRSRHTTQLAISLIEQELHHDAACMELAEFCKHTKRGIASYMGTAGFEE